MINRRHFMQTAGSAGLAAGLSSLLPAWARGAEHGNHGMSAETASTFDLSIDQFPVSIDGRRGTATGINGTLPGPLLRFREGEDVTLNVSNGLKVDTSIHWHGLLVPFQMDGVPGVTFPGIKPSETFQYKFAVPQSGTYWYHSHSGLQEQVGHYGPIIIDPAGPDPVQYDREYVIVLSDWSFENPHRIFAKLKAMSDTYNFSQRTLPDFFDDASETSFSEALGQRSMWGAMRMSPRDIADVSGATYTYLINGHATSDNWSGLFVPGERVRLRIINASAMTLFNVRIPGLPMTIVASDGLNVQPLEVDEFQMGVAETYDVIVEPKDTSAYAFTAEATDRSGQVVATLSPDPAMRATAPALRAVPTLTMQDMAMDHASMGHDMGAMEEMDDAPVDHSMMDHAAMGHDMGAMDMAAPSKLTRGPGVANVAEMPTSRLGEPGTGLQDMPHRTLRYSELRSLDPNPDIREPEREITLHLTGNMERYMWSFDGVKFAHIKEAITMHEGERVRMTLINNTMMSHPIHLHGMFFELENGGGDHRPRKHTVIVKPGEKLSYDVTADNVGDWAFHCHLLYHMHAGMMQIVSVLPRGEMMDEMDHSTMDHGSMGHDEMDEDEVDHSTMDHSMMNHGEDE